jgi:hypothetical protein
MFDSDSGSKLLPVLADGGQPPLFSRSAALQEAQMPATTSITWFYRSSNSLFLLLPTFTFLHSPCLGPRSPNLATISVLRCLIHTPSHISSTPSLSLLPTSYNNFHSEHLVLGRIEIDQSCTHTLTRLVGFRSGSSPSGEQFRSYVMARGVDIPH